MFAFIKDLVIYSMEKKGGGSRTSDIDPRVFSKKFSFKCFKITVCKGEGAERPIENHQGQAKELTLPVGGGTHS